MSNQDIRARINDYIKKRDALFEKEKQELVSNCCSYPMPDTNSDYCPNCGEYCKRIELKKEK
jgi:hypothetical protein